MSLIQAQLALRAECSREVWRTRLSISGRRRHFGGLGLLIAFMASNSTMNGSESISLLAPERPRPRTSNQQRGRDAARKKEKRKRNGDIDGLLRPAGT